MTALSTLTQDPQEWAEHLFSDEYCVECHGDERDHDILGFLGNWFARCKDDAVCRVEDCPIPWKEHTETRLELQRQ